jgi:Cu2+-exporting ATPase
LTDLEAQVPPEIKNVIRTWATDGRTVLYVIVESRVFGALAVEDEIRPESVEANRITVQPGNPSRHDHG